MPKRWSKLDEALKEFRESLGPLKEAWDHFQSYGPQTEKNQYERSCAYDATVEPSWRFEFARRKLEQLVGTRRLPVVYKINEEVGVLIQGGRATVCRIDELDY